MSRTGRHVLVLLVVVVGTAVLGLVLDRTVHAPQVGSGPEHAPAPTGHPARATRGEPLPPVPSGVALDAVGRLAVLAGPAGSAYERAAFGQVWLDTDRNGCDTRNDVLRRDLVGARLKPGTRGCVVLSGTLRDPYTGADLDFVRGSATSQLVQVDHVVALADAWRTGAAGWSPARREGFATDPLELLAVDGRVNAAKGDGAAATGLPPSGASRCAYAARQVAVKLTWGLLATPPEAEALARVLRACPAEHLPGRSPFVLGPGD